MSYLKSIGTAVVYISLILAVITFIPGLPPETEFVEYRYYDTIEKKTKFIWIMADHYDFRWSWFFDPCSITPPRQLDLKIGPKNRLNGIQKLFTGEIHAPESFDSYNGQLYTGIHGGYVLRIEEDRIVPIVKFGEKCGKVI